MHKECPRSRARSRQAGILHGMWSSRCASFSPRRVFQEKCISRETGITSSGGNSKLFLQPLKIPLGKGTHGVGTGICLPTEPGIILRATPSLHLIYPPGMPREPEVVTPPFHTPQHPLEGSDIIPILRRLYVDCGKEDWERERAMLSEMWSRERRKTLERHKPLPSSQAETGSAAGSPRTRPCHWAGKGSWPWTLQ